MIAVVTEEAGTGNKFPIIEYTPGNAEQFERAKDVVETMRSLGLHAHVKGQPTTPWGVAGIGEVWALTNQQGYTKVYVRSDGGMRSVGRKGQLYSPLDFTRGTRLWRAEFEPYACPNKDMHHQFSVRCFRCGTLLSVGKDET